MKGKDHTGTIILVVGLLLVAFIVVKMGGLFAVTSLPQIDYDELYSIQNLNENPGLETWCHNPTDHYTTGVRMDTGAACSIAAPAGREWPWDWETYYGENMLRSTDSLEGTYSNRIYKTTFDDWYGFGSHRYPATPGEVYETWFYTKEEYKAGDSRSCRAAIYFLDSGGNNIPDVEVLEDGNIGDEGSGWIKISRIARAPVYTEEVQLQIWCAQYGTYDLYVDALYVGPGIICNPGTTQVCGSTDVGACSYGVRTCEAGGYWGVCNGDIHPIPEVCMNDRDDDCDGLADESPPCSEEDEATPEDEKDDMIIYLIGGVMLIGAVLLGFGLKKK